MRGRPPIRGCRGGGRGRGGRGRGRGSGRGGRGGANDSSRHIREDPGINNTYNIDMLKYD